MDGMGDGWMRIRRSWILSLICIVVILISGCGNTAGKADEDGNGEDRTADPSGLLGRYMETVYELPEEINRNGGLNWLADGSLSIISFGSGLYRSLDEGQSWKQEETAWFPMIQNVYCLDAVMGPDGTVAATCSGHMPEAARKACTEPVKEDWEGNYCVFAFPDGTVKIIDFGFSQEEGTCICSFWFREDGRLFAGDISGRVYEVNAVNAGLKELFMADREIGYVDFSGSVLMAVGYDRLYQYDLSQEVLLAQDTTVDEFLKQILTDGTVSYTSGGYPLTVMGGENDTIYIACRNGLYRHALGGSVMEQVIDGALSTFGDSFSSIYSARALDNQEFLVLFSPSTGLVRYTFNENIPSMPDKELRIYSLEESTSVRQAVTAYKKEHTDMYVRYETGIEGNGSGVTAEDAIKKLNTQILAGEGPDVLILDGLLLDAYIDKGLLTDISQVLESLDGEDTLFPNLVNGSREKDGAIYAMPMCIQVPLLAGDQDVLENINDLESFADSMEMLRKENPEGGILGIYDAETLLRLFGMVSSSAWMNQDGKLDTDRVKNFLSQIKRIYEAELSGAVTEEVSVLKSEDETLLQYGEDIVAVKMEICHNVLNIPRGYARLACGFVESIQLCLNNVTSVLREDDRMSYRIFNGQGQNIFIPRAMVGISAKAGYQEEAEAFVRRMFSEETQKNMYEGFPVNQAAFEAAFDFAKPGSGNGCMTLQKLDGTEEELELYWPDTEEKEDFREKIKTLESPVRTSDYLGEIVYETGVRVLEGSLSVEDAAQEIERKAAIYLAE